MNCLLFVYHIYSLTKIQLINIIMKIQFITRKYLMVKLKAAELLSKKGKTKYRIYKQMGMSYQNFNKMINNETKSIQYSNI